MSVIDEQDTPMIFGYAHASGMPRKRPETDNGEASHA
jgi:hypothetical protein